MTQASTFGVPRTGPKSPTDMFTQLDDNLDALLSNHSGASRPSYAVAGTIWADTSVSGVTIMKFFDGSNDQEIYRLDSSGNFILPTLKMGSDINLAGNGLINVASVNGKNSGPYENKLINPDFRVNQRLVTGTVVLAAGEYGHDRWRGGSSGCTYTFASTENVTVVSIHSGSLQQVIPGYNLSSGDHCLSWSGTAQARIDGGSYGNSGLTGSATGGTNLTVEFGLGSISNVCLIEGVTPGIFLRTDKAIETSKCLSFWERQLLLLTLQAGVYNTHQWQAKKQSTPILSVTGGAIDSAGVGDDYWYVTVTATSNNFVTAIGDSEIHS